MRTRIASHGLVIALGLGAACSGGGGGDECRDASCVRDVRVTRVETIWNEDGTSSTAPAWDTANLALDAFVTDATGQARTIAAERDGSGWVLRGVPGGRYRLRMVNSYAVPYWFETEASEIDLGWDVGGRPAAIYPSTSTVATLELSGLVPWSTADHLQLVSWNAGLSNAFEPVIDPYATTAIAPYDFASTGWDGSDPLLVAADRLHAIQFRAGSNATAAWARPVALGSASGVTMLEGRPTTIPLVMAPVVSDRQVSVDWKATRFEAHLAAMGAGATAKTYPHWLYVSAAPVRADLSAGIGGRTDLLMVSAPAGADASVGAIAYANVAPSVAFRERAQAAYTAEVPRAAPGATPIQLTASIGREDPAVPDPIQPLVTPPREVRIAGRDASSPQMGVGTAPALSWLPPVVGHADAYLVTVRELYADAGQTRAATVTSIRTAATETTLPPGVLVAGRTYVLVIEARAGSYPPEAPFRTRVPGGWARTVTQTFSP